MMWLMLFDHPYLSTSSPSTSYASQERVWSMSPFIPALVVLLILLLLIGLFAMWQSTFNGPGWKQVERGGGPPISRGMSPTYDAAANGNGSRNTSPPDYMNRSSGGRGVRDEENRHNNNNSNDDSDKEEDQYSGGDDDDEDGHKTKKGRLVSTELKGRRALIRDQRVAAQKARSYTDKTVPLRTIPHIKPSTSSSSSVLSPSSARSKGRSIAPPSPPTPPPQPSSYSSSSSSSSIGASVGVGASRDGGSGGGSGGGGGGVRGRGVGAASGGGGSGGGGVSGRGVGAASGGGGGGGGGVRGRGGGAGGGSVRGVSGHSDRSLIVASNKNCLSIAGSCAPLYVANQSARLVTAVGGGICKRCHRSGCSGKCGGSGGGGDCYGGGGGGGGDDTLACRLLRTAGEPLVPLDPNNVDFITTNRPILVDDNGIPVPPDVWEDLMSALFANALNQSLVPPVVAGWVLNNARIAFVTSSNVLLTTLQTNIAAQPATTTELAPFLNYFQQELHLSESLMRRRLAVATGRQVVSEVLIINRSVFLALNNPAVQSAVEKAIREQVYDSNWLMTYPEIARLLAAAVARTYEQQSFDVYDSISIMIGAITRYSSILSGILGAATFADIPMTQINQLIAYIGVSTLYNAMNQFMQSIISDCDTDFGITRVSQTSPDGLISLWRSAIGGESRILTTATINMLWCQILYYQGLITTSTYMLAEYYHFMVVGSSQQAYNVVMRSGNFIVRMREVYAPNFPPSNVKVIVVINRIQVNGLPWTEIEFGARRGTVWLIQDPVEDETNLYTWTEAAPVAASVSVGLPTGWRLPTVDEVDELLSNKPVRLPKRLVLDGDPTVAALAIGTTTESLTFDLGGMNSTAAAAAALSSGAAIPTDSDATSSSYVMTDLEYFRYVGLAYKLDKFSPTAGTNVTFWCTPTCVCTVNPLTGSRMFSAPPSTDFRANVWAVHTYEINPLI